MTIRFVLGFLIGFLIGASIALAFATQPGEAMRRTFPQRVRTKAPAPAGQDA